MVGNFIADTVKGNAFEEYEVEIQKGILLHRFIDSFTDSHPITLESRKKLYSDFGKYAAVVQDVFYDHFLAVNWAEYQDGALGEFTEFVYNALGEYRSVFNDKAARTFHFMQLQDWLGSYATTEGIDRALTGLSRRASFKSNMERSLPALAAHEDSLSNEFQTFFPELISASKLKLSELTG